MFPITMSHLRRIAYCFVYEECINHLWRWQFHIKIDKLWTDDNATWGCVYNFGGGKQSKMSKGECESFWNQIRIISASF
jgi:hypothetical protein